MTREDVDCAVNMLLDAKHRLVVNGRYLRSADEIPGYDGAQARMAWTILDHAQAHIIDRLYRYLTGRAA